MPGVLTCPLCRNRLAGLVARCPACGGDLGPLAQLQDLANRHFNDAVRLARDGKWYLAAESLAVALALDPGDEEALGLLKKVRHHQERQPRRAARPA